MALLSDGSVAAWGFNRSNGSLSPSSVPVAVEGFGGKVTAIAAGFVHSVALMEDGTIKTWGGNYSGQLGDGGTNDSITPIAVTGLGGRAIAIAAGYCHTVVLMADGTIRTWGSNIYGSLGDGTNIESSIPVSITGLGGQVVSIVAGDFHTMVLMADGTVKAWGLNAAGQLGNGSTANSNIPVTVNGIDGVVSAISAGWSHSLALMADGTVKTWGENIYGQFGNGTTVSSISPLNVLINLK